MKYARRIYSSNRLTMPKFLNACYQYKADSISKCNTVKRLHKHLMGRFEPETFTGSVVESVHGKFNLLLCNGIETTLLGEVLADKSIKVFIGSPLPGSVGMRKMEVVFSTILLILDRKHMSPLNGLIDCLRIFYE